MTDAAWAQGMKQLLALGLPGWPQDPQEADVRAGAMRQALDDLDDERWLFACEQAGKLQTWFPVPATLRSYADDYRPEPKYPLLPPARDAESRERDREAARRGVELVRRALREQGIVLADVAKEWP